ncbi:MAG: hypothetical protein R3F17_00255 [Planctomycetota bacterium]
MICPDHYENQVPQHEPALRPAPCAPTRQHWFRMDEGTYAAEKARAWQEGHAAIRPFAPDIRPHTIFTDTFTPRTIARFTGHVERVVYGSPRKSPEGRTDLDQLYLCGTDQDSWASSARCVERHRHGQPPRPRPIGLRILTMRDKHYYAGHRDGKRPLKKDPWAKAQAEYDVIVIGSLGGLTAANILARRRPPRLRARTALQLRRARHVVQTQGRPHLRHLAARFPAGMIKTCRKYWSPQIASRIVH